MRLPRLRRLALLPALLGCLAATTVPELSFEEVVARSSAIVHGTVVSSSSAWDPERTAIWTHYRIQVQTALKGGPGAMLTLSEPGGEVDGKHMEIAGAPRYEVGDEVVVFASPTPIGYLRTCGWGQGKYEVRRTGGAESTRVTRASPLGVQLLSSAKSAAAQAPPDGAGLEAFFARVRSVVAAQGPRGAR